MRLFKRYDDEVEWNEVSLDDPHERAILENCYKDVDLLRDVPQFRTMVAHYVWSDEAPANGREG